MRDVVEPHTLDLAIAVHGQADRQRSERPDQRGAAIGIATDYERWPQDRPIQIAAAQMYFAVKTREAEMAQQPKSELELARDYVRALEAKEELRAQIAELEPKAEKWEKYLSADGLIGMRELADMIGLNAPEMTARLVEMNVFRRQTSERGGGRNMPRRMYQLSGHFVVRTEENNGHRFPVAYATASGIDFVMQHLG